jgi:hypothetical protein
LKHLLYSTLYIIRSGFDQNKPWNLFLFLQTALDSVAVFIPPCVQRVAKSFSNSNRIKPLPAGSLPRQALKHPQSKTCHCIKHTPSSAGMPVLAKIEDFLHAIGQFCDARRPAHRIMGCFSSGSSKFFVIKKAGRFSESGQPEEELVIHQLECESSHPGLKPHLAVLVFACSQFSAVATWQATYRAQPLLTGSVPAAISAQ